MANTASNWGTTVRPETRERRIMHADIEGIPTDDQKIPIAQEPEQDPVHAPNRNSDNVRPC